MSCDVGEVMERLENELCYDYNYELCSFSNLPVTSPISQLILQPFPLLYLCHSSFSNPSIASPMSQFILQPFFRFSYVTCSSLNSPGELPMMVVLNSLLLTVLKIKLTHKFYTFLVTQIRIILHYSVLTLLVPC